MLNQEERDILIRVDENVKLLREDWKAADPMGTREAVENLKGQIKWFRRLAVLAFGTILAKIGIDISF